MSGIPCTLKVHWFAFHCHINGFHQGIHIKFMYIPIIHSARCPLKDYIYSTFYGTSGTNTLWRVIECYKSHHECLMLFCDTLYFVWNVFGNFLQWYEITLSKVIYSFSCIIIVVPDTAPHYTSPHHTTPYHTIGTYTSLQCVFHHEYEWCVMLIV